MMRGPQNMREMLERDVVLEWCEPWPGADASGRPSNDASVTLSARASDCARMQRYHRIEAGKDW